MRAAVVRQFNEPLRIGDLPIPVPGHGEVVVQLETSGLCHTDIHAAHEKGEVDAWLVFDVRG